MDRLHPATPTQPGSSGTQERSNGGLLTAEQVPELLGVPKSWVYEQSRLAAYRQ